ncbi:AfsR/SARP family transcriptional regulator [Sphaerisporangium corydalis]|uniref:BTAD domain-containing putative transcriptional regulator n=1 Tax=Sphaerisporangium corydalis TaxID=1441875 RepID=A0ABV9ESP9_9ACTN|nr:BTAD domain-containing putative transcriptional regulator [Sphaerisporangium corydalis]
MSDHGLRFSILGPVRAWRDGAEVELGSPQQRLVLAVLVLAEGRVVGHEPLLDAVWSDDRPRTAMSTLRTYVSRLRSALGAEAVESAGGGYALAGGESDLAVMEELAAAGRYGEALALWHGEPLAGLEGRYAEGRRVRLEQRRLAVLERRLAEDVEQGRHADAVAELTALCAEHPAREQVCGLLMLALYRSGRQAEAIGVYTDTRRLLAEDLGVGPSPELAELYQRIITADPALGVGQAAAPVQATAPVPRQLPADLTDFTGREPEIQRIAAGLRSGDASALVISAVAGAGGMGKTALAVHVAHRLAPDYPGGQLFVDLRGTSAQPLAPEAVLGSFLRSLGVEASDIPDEPAERAALYRSVLAERRVLVVLDNAANPAQLRPLLPGTAGCAVLATGRAKMIGLSGARQVDLGVLGHDEAVALLAKVAGRERVAAEPEAAGELAAACGYLPLAIRIVAARLAARPAWSLARMRDRMADERRRLAELRVDDLAVEATFALGYDQLDAAHASAFRLLAVPDAPESSLSAAAAVLGLDEADAEDVCETLVDVSMLESPAQGRYRYHDLLKIFARSRPAGEDVTRAALFRLLDFYLATVATGFRLAYPGKRLADAVSPAHPGLSFADLDAAVAWADGEVPGLLGCVLQAARTPGAPLLDLVRLLDMLSDGFGAETDPGRLEQVVGAIIDAAAARGDRRAEAHARCMRGEVRVALLWSPDGAIEDGTAARDLSLAEGDMAKYGASLNLLAMAVSSRRDNAGAIALYREANEIWREIGDRKLEATGLGNLAMELVAAGETGEAVEAVERATRITRELGGRMDHDVLYQSAVVLRDAGRPQEALSRFTEVLAEYRVLKQRLWEGVTLLRMAETHLVLGRPAAAADRAEDALAVMAEVGHEWVEGKALVALGQALALLGRAGRARACLTEALEIFQRRDLPEADDVRALLAEDGGTGDGDPGDVTGDGDPGDGVPEDGRRPIIA